MNHIMSLLFSSSVCVWERTYLCCVGVGQSGFRKIDDQFRTDPRVLMWRAVINEWWCCCCGCCGCCGCCCDQVRLKSWNERELELMASRARVSVVTISITLLLNDYPRQVIMIEIRIIHIVFPGFVFGYVFLHWLVFYIAFLFGCFEIRTIIIKSL